MFDYKTHEGKKYGLLSIIFSLIIGSYWLFRPVKDAVFLTMIGNLHQPKAKMISFALSV